MTQSTQLINVVVNGYIIPVTPLCQLPYSKKKSSKNSKDNKDNTTLMAYQEFILSEEAAERIYKIRVNRKLKEEAETDIKDTEEKVSRCYRVPIFTANGIRGLLRRKAGYPILNAISKREKIKNYEIIDLIRVGGGRNAKNILKSTFDELNKYIIEKNPHIGLFGGTLSIPGRLYGSDAIPLTVETAEWLHKRKMKAPGSIEEASDLPFLSQIRDFRGWVRKNDWGKDLEEFNWFTEEEIRQICEDIAEGKKKINKDKEQNKKSDLVNIENLGEYEYIVPGTKMCVRFELCNVTDVMLGMFVNGWLNFARDPYMGALRRYDFGRVWFDFTIQIEGGENYTLKMVSSNHAEVFQDDQEVTEQILEPFNAYLERVMADDLDVFKHLKWEKK